MIKPDQIIRSRRKSIAITVNEQGQLIVRAPLRCDEARILAFVEKKSEWIQKQIARMKDNSELLPTEDLNGYSFLLKGERIQIIVSDNNRIFLEGDKLYIPIEAEQKDVADWLRKQAETVFPETVVRFSEIMECEISSISVSNARTRWGSCTYDNKIRLAFRLIYTPKEIMEYVVIHELAHTKYKNHGRLFWNTVERYCPNYKAYRRWLKNHGYFMNIF